MKRFIAIFTAAVMLLCLAACGGASSSTAPSSSAAAPVSSTAPSSSASQPVSSSSAAEAVSSSEAASSAAESVAIPESGVENASEAVSSEPEASSSEAASEPEATASKSLVVYFSWSGNTEAVAQEIADQTGSDSFEIVPATPYTQNYNDLLDLAQQEQRNDARPEISGSIENIADYDVIYVGYPNWWGDMPMIIYSFFDAYDLSGKTVAPFVTSGGSGLSGTVNTIRSLEPNATVIAGLSIGSSSASNSTSAVSGWLSSNGLAE